MPPYNVKKAFSEVLSPPQLQHLQGIPQSAVQEPDYIIYIWEQQDKVSFYSNPLWSQRRMYGRSAMLCNEGSIILHLQDGKNFATLRNLPTKIVDGTLAHISLYEQNTVASWHRGVTLLVLRTAKVVACNGRHVLWYTNQEALELQDLRIQRFLRCH